jgi:AraC family ethanolamine operon transcriptional activator
MNYQDFSSDIQLKDTFFVTSVEEIEEQMKAMGIDQSVRQLGTGKFECAVAETSTDMATFVCDRFNTSVSVHLESAQDAVTLLIPRSLSGEFYANGKNLSNEKLVVFPEGPGVDIVAHGILGSESVIFDKSKYIEMTELLQPEVPSLKSAMTVSGNTKELDALRQNIHYIVANGAGLPRDETVSNFLAQLIMWASENSGGYDAAFILKGNERARISKQAQSYIEENYRSEVSIDLLCAATGVGVRTLQRCFREYFNMTISDYLKTVRLDAAYRDLAVGHSSEYTVGEIALAHGFSHLGRFGTDFGNRFGQSARSVLKAKK